MNDFYTYAYLREDRTPYYIGKGQGRRIFNRQKKDIKPPKDKSRVIYLKQNLTEEEAFKHEIYMIDVFGRKDLGTGILHNRTDGGEGSSGCIPSEETKRKLSEVNKGKTLSEETRRKIGEANKDKILSEEHKKKLSDAHKDKILSEEHKKKLSDAHKGKTTSEETKRKQSEANKGKPSNRKGSIQSEEIKKLIGENMKGRKWWNDGCGNRKFVVECPGDDWRLGRK